MCDIYIRLNVELYRSVRLSADDNELLLLVQSIDVLSSPDLASIRSAVAVSSARHSIVAKPSPKKCLVLQPVATYTGCAKSPVKLSFFAFYMKQLNI